MKKTIFFIFLENLEEPVIPAHRLLILYLMDARYQGTHL
jgi:hypothetical protein